MKNYYKMTTWYKADQIIISGCGQKYYIKSFQKAGSISSTFTAIYEELKLEATKKIWRNGKLKNDKKVTIIRKLSVCIHVLPQSTEDLK